MPNTLSAKKYLRAAIRRKDINRMRISKLRTFTRKMNDAIKSGKKQEALIIFRQVESVLAKGANKGVVHKRNVSNKVSLFSKKIKAISG